MTDTNQDRAEGEGRGETHIGVPCKYCDGKGRYQRCRPSGKGGWQWATCRTCEGVGRLFPQSAIDRAVEEGKRLQAEEDQQIAGAVDRLADQTIADLRAEREAIDKLRADEGSSVEIFCDNPEFGDPNNRVDCTGAWTNWKPRTFWGKSVSDCLSAALSALDGKEGEDHG